MIYIVVKKLKVSSHKFKKNSKKTPAAKPRWRCVGNLQKSSEFAKLAALD